jgi:hypothetical protein
MQSKEVYSETLKGIAENERHFHTIQAGVRGLASTWMLAAFASIAVLLKQEKDITWLFSPFALTSMICLMANTGLSVLWIIDQLVYQRLFNTNYLAGLRLEQQFSSIPPVRAIQAVTTQGISIASWVKFFYVGPMLVFAVTALFVIVIPSKPGKAIYVAALLTLVPLVWVIYYARNVSFFLLAASLPVDFSTILKEENCLAIIDRHIQRLNAEDPSVEKTEEESQLKGNAA